MVFHRINDTKDELISIKNGLKENCILIIIDLDEGHGSFHKEIKDYPNHNSFTRNDLEKLIIDVDLLA